ncbi:MAG: twin-arginine translocase TatA/TatE family subunit [Wenzhouxiangella sp.]|nr:MAG: twin-arginine translocase TatA/TatE family subunit [Wenzhouxiangella sp.]
MGFGNIGWFQILIVLLIVLLVFGTKKIRNLGGDLGGAIRDFRKGVSEDPDEAKEDAESQADEVGEEQPDGDTASGKSRDA